MNRTINSAKSFLAGFYLKSFLVDTNEPFLINVNDGETDYLYPNIFNCSYLNEFYKVTSNKHELLEKAEYVKFIDSLGEEVGSKVPTSPFGLLLSLYKLPKNFIYSKLFLLAAIAFLDDLRAREVSNFLRL